MKIKNKIAIITGGSSGIGKVISALFVKEGAKVIIASKNSKEGVKISNKLGADFIKTDITNLSDVKNLVKSIFKKHGKIDILVNNVGYIKPAYFEKTTEQMWDKTLDTNLKGTFYMCKEVIPYMKKQKYGKIINISSIAAIEGSLVSVPYAVAKAGVIGLTKSLAKEYNNFNIKINALAPGPTKTGMIKKIPEKLIKKIKTTQKLNKPEDIAKIVLFLASDESNKINGKIIVIKGGKAYGQTN